MGIAYVVSMFSGVIEISMFVNAATSGTLVGVFILAMLVPFANSRVSIIKHAIRSMFTLIAIEFPNKNECSILGRRHRYDRITFDHNRVVDFNILIEKFGGRWIATNIHWGNYLHARVRPLEHLNHFN